MAGQTLVTLKIEGMEQLERRLKGFPERMQRRAVGRMLYAGATIVRDEARPKVYKAPQAYYRRLKDKLSGTYGGQLYQPGWVAKNIAIRSKKRSRGLVYQAYLKSRAWWGRFIEYGFLNNPAMPFLRPALYNNVPKIIAAMRKRLEEWLRKEEAKL